MQKAWEQNEIVFKNINRNLLEIFTWQLNLLKVSQKFQIVEVFLN